MNDFELLEAQLIQIVEEAYAAMWTRLEDEEDPQGAIDEYFTTLEEALSEFHRRAYRLGQEQALGDEDDPLRRALLGIGWMDAYPKGLQFQLHHLRLMLDELTLALEFEDLDDLQDRYNYRALLYAKSLWNPYQRGKIYFDDENARYLWQLIPGNTSDTSCEGCIWQRRQPPRTLAEMNWILPGDEDCGSNCRDELVRE